MSRKVYSRSALTAAQIKTIERAQFAPTTKKHQEWYSGQQKTLHYLFKAESSVEEYTSIEDFLRPMNKPKNAVKVLPLDELAIQKNGFKLTKRELGTIICAKREKDMRTTVQPGMANEYLKMICFYVNSVRNREIAMKSTSCVTLTHEQFDAIRGNRAPGKLEALCINTLRNLGFNSLHAFMELDYLLIPSVQNFGHSLLVGIAPKQRFVFVIDSGNATYNDTSNIVKGLTALLLSLTPDFFYTKDPRKPKPEDWTVFGQWSLRTKTADGSPNAAQQNDLYNCGVFTSTSAFCLAFGFDLTCYVEADLDKFKKPRMVAEFVNGGFFGPGFDYDLLDLPQYRAQTPSQAGPSGTQPQTVSTGRLAPKPKAKPTTPAPSRTPSSRIRKFLSSHKRRQSNDDGDHVQRGFGDEEEAEGSGGESDDEDSLGFKKEPLYARPHVGYALCLTPASSGLKRKNNVPFPPQFNSEIHQQATLIYGGLPELFNLQDRKYSKRELKQACRDFTVENWKPWSFERQGFFMKFVMNEINGIMARRGGDDVPPIDGIGEVSELKVETAPIRTQRTRASKRLKRAGELVQTAASGVKTK